MTSALVIDEFRPTADGLCKLLRFLGINAFAAYGPLPAIVTIIEGIPDIIFIALNVGGVSGCEEFDSLLKEPKYHKIPLVVVTSNDELDWTSTGHRKGKFKILLNPISMKNLEETLRSIDLAK